VLLQALCGAQTEIDSGPIVEVHTRWCPGWKATNDRGPTACRLHDSPRSEADGPLAAARISVGVATASYQIEGQLNEKGSRKTIGVPELLRKSAAVGSALNFLGATDPLLDRTTKALVENAFRLSPRVGSGRARTASL